MKRRTSRAIPVLAAALCALPAFAQSHVSQQSWGKHDGKDVVLVTLRNSAGMEVHVSTYGGTITYISTPDRNKKFADIVLGFDSVEGYASPANKSYYGATIGRYANRLAKGTFSLDGKTYHVPVNEPPNTLHGGTKGFDKQVWDLKSASSDKNNAWAEMHYLSKDGEQGFPGNLNVDVKFTLTSKNEVRIDYTATTDKDTVLNLTNHSYFNLSGPGSGTILDNKVMLAADKYTPVNKTLIPTGAIDAVAGTPFDFRTLQVVGTRINDKNEQLKIANGYDQNWVLNHPALDTVQARVEDPKSGRVIEVFTTEPGIQFYTGNFLNGTNKGVGGTYNFRGALTLETQHYPDSPNHPNFPSTELKPGQTFHSTTIYRFSTM